MRFYLVDRIQEVVPRQRIVAAKLVSSLDPVLESFPPLGPVLPPPLVLECLAQTGAWLVLSSTDFAQRAVLGSFRRITSFQPALLGDWLELTAEIESWTEDTVVINVEACCRGQQVLEAETALCPIIRTEQLEDPACLRAHYAHLWRPHPPPPIPVTGVRGLTTLANQPAAYPWIPFDVVQQLLPGERVTALKSVVMTDPIFDTHFPRFPVMPGVLLTQSCVELARELLRASVSEKVSWHLREIRAPKFRQFVRPGDQLEFEVRLLSVSNGIALLTASARTDGKRALDIRQMEMYAQTDNAS